MNKKAIVVGSGFGGIAISLRLKKLGYDTTIIEKLNDIGGRARVFEVNGFKHDAGPTVITAPFLFDELFSLFGKKRKDYLNFVPLEPWYRYYFHDGKTFDYCSTVEKTNQQIRKFNKDDIKGYAKLLEKSNKIFDIGFTQLADKPFTSFFKMLGVVPSLIILKSYLTVSQLVNKYLKNPYLRKAFSIHPLLVGGDPHTTTSIYALIHYLERKWGVFFCMGGTGKIVLELKKLMVDNGINIKTNTEVKQFILENNKISKIITNDEVIKNFDLVVCNADPPMVYSNLLSKYNFNRPFKKEKNLMYSMGLFVLFFGTKEKYNDVAHHTIWMTERFKSLLNDIFKKKKLSEDFSLYIHRPTATDSSFAPDGCDSFYVLCPVPNLQGKINWEIESQNLKDKIISELSKTIMPNLERTITDVFWMNPNDFKNDYNSMHGSGFSIAPIFTQSAWFRYHNKDKKIKNLYFSAAGSHPGAGIPGVLSSAKVVENIIKSELNNQ
ncbi:phytoene desaturase family protein [Pelagibacteraceae bacterium]|nr:phytoene desaturase family protein [Pelagibacteraceae bacterium]